MSSTRLWLSFLILILVLAGVVFLAAGLPDMDFGLGQLFRLPEQAERAAEEVLGKGPEPNRNLLLELLIVLMLVSYPIFVIWGLLNKRMRKRVLRDLGLMVLIVALGLLAYREREEEYLRPLAAPASDFAVEGDPSGRTVIEAIFDPTSPDWIPTSLLVAGGLLVAALAAVLVWRRLAPGGGAPPPEDARQELLDEANQAVQALDDGEELEDVILRTYYRMERILARERNLDRPHAMTPSEFADKLTRAGLPPGAVADLTRLFELVRYGQFESRPEMQLRARNALLEIVLSQPAALPRRA